jgi:carbamoyl-phosphate synthase large subunit
MGIDKDMGLAYAKGQLAAGTKLPLSGNVFVSLNRRDKVGMAGLGKELIELGFRIIATEGTAAALRADGLEVEEVFKVGQGRPNVVDRIINGEVDWIINTPLGVDSKQDEIAIRRTALERGVPTMTTLAAARAAVRGIRALKGMQTSVYSLQEYHADSK